MPVNRGTHADRFITDIHEILVAFFGSHRESDLPIHLHGHIHGLALEQLPDRNVCLCPLVISAADVQEEAQVMGLGPEDGSGEYKAENEE
jgi:hypothetical protein